MERITLRIKSILNFCKYFITPFICENITIYLVRICLIRLIIKDAQIVMIKSQANIRKDKKSINIRVNRPKNRVDGS